MASNMAIENTARTVLRVKRRRTEDPFQVLLVQPSARKRPKTDGNEDAENKGSCMFKFAGTTSESGSLDNKRLLESLHSQQKCQTEISKGLHNCRRRNPCIENYGQSSEKPSTFRIISNSQLTDTERYESLMTPSPEDDCRKGTIEIFDIESIGSTESVQQSCDMKQDTLEDTDAIYCNSVKMIREKLKISDDSEIEDPDYVYDLYYANEKRINSCDELLFIQTLDQEILFDFEINGQFEDEDHVNDDCDEDSNDENNWRNEYPDEYDFASSNENGNSDSDGESDCSLDEEDVFHEYRSSDARIKFIPFHEDETGNYNFEAYDEEKYDSDV